VGYVGYLGSQVVEKREDFQVCLQLGLQVDTGIPVLQLAGQRQALIPVTLNLR